MKKIFTLILALIIVCVCKTNAVTAQVNVQDSLALVDLYNSTNGPNWQFNNWLTSAPVSTWDGITVSNNRVTAIQLGGLGEDGPLPSSIGNLTALTSFSAAQGITGTIPSTIGNCTALEYLALFFCNSLNGPLPSTLGNLTNLQILYLYSDSITGTIPSSLGNLAKLRFCYLAGNQLTGSIPASFNNLTSLDTLDVSFNQLSHAIPDLTALSNLKLLSLRNNSFTFNGMQSIATTFPFAQYQYQRNISIHNNNHVLSVFAGGTLLNNTYKWYKDGSLYETISGDSTLAVSETGSYMVTVSNSIATGLNLYSDSIDFNGVLAVKNLSFTVTKQNQQTLLQWSTAEETNTSYFVIERSINGINYTTINKVHALGNTTKNSYSFKDDLSNIHAQTSIVFYRLKIVDKDGSYTYSEIRNIKLNDNLFIKLYPNPAKTNTTLSFAATGKYTITISDVLGKVLQTKTGIANNENVIQLNVSKYVNGIYLITVTDQNKNRQIVKFIKE